MSSDEEKKKKFDELQRKIDELKSRQSKPLPKSESKTESKTETKPKPKEKSIDDKELKRLKKELEEKEDIIRDLKERLNTQKECDIITVKVGQTLAQVNKGTIETIFKKIMEIDSNNQELKDLYANKQRTWNPKNISIEDSKLSVVINDILNDPNKLQYYQKYEQTIKMLANGLSQTQIIDYVKKYEYQDPTSLLLLSRGFNYPINDQTVPNNNLTQSQLAEMKKQQNRDGGTLIKLLNLVKRFVDPVQSVSVQIINQNISDIADLGKCSNDLDSATLETIKEYLQNIIYDAD